MEIVNPISEMTVAEQIDHIRKHKATFVLNFTDGQIEAVGLHLFADALASYDIELRELSEFPREMNYGEAKQVLIERRLSDQGVSQNGKHERT